MELKKIKKLVLKQETISNLNEDGMNKIKGGSGWVTCSGYVACDTSTCVSYLATGTGYGVCCCAATDYC
jgi:natural product precursor